MLIRKSGDPWGRFGTIIRIIIRRCFEERFKISLTHGVRKAIFIGGMHEIILNVVHINFIVCFWSSGQSKALFHAEEACGS